MLRDQSGHALSKLAVNTISLELAIEEHVTSHHV